ncbi:MAG: ABC transporter permease [Propionibacteriaceae bacterium]|nr:ABC transporter permease [Propionibacteriaceae bacterium]
MPPSSAPPRQPSFTGWLLRRLVRACAQFLAASLLLFLLIQALPGDAATVQVGQQGSAAVAAERNRLGLDRPVLERYLRWFTDAFRGDLGNTFASSRPVVETIAQPALASLTVATVVLLGLLLVTLPLGVISGARPTHPLSRVLTTISVTLVAIPEFVVAIVLLGGLAVWARWLPVLSVPGAGKTVWDNPVCLVLPSLILWLICSAALIRRIQALVATHAAAPYVREAELAGLTQHRVLLGHLLPSAAPGILQLLAQTVPYLLGGAVVVETVTSFPGLGYTLVQSVGNREVPVVMAIGSLMMGIAMVAFSCADAVAVRQERMVAVV